MPSAPGSVPPYSRGSVFVVEDDDELLQSLSAVLAHNGFGVQGVPSAREALAKLEAGLVPDVILLDLRLPNMSGWEFRLEQRLLAPIAAIPVVAMSADESPQARAIDANAYLRKPFEAQVLVDTIERVMVQAERARLAAHTAEFERLRALGLLAAGIAHEINNPLTFVAGNADLVRKVCSELKPRLGADEAAMLQTLEGYLTQLDQGVERVEAVVRSVATFSRPNQADVVPIDVNEVMTASVRLIANEMRHRAQLRLDLPPVPSVVGDPAQMGQVFLNVLINAMHAIPERAVAENTVHVTTQARGDVVSIGVADTGAGMTPEVAARIFEPFFTTKPIGRGMGLGLSISRGIVSAMGGTITVRSQVGKGSTFRIDLPAHGLPADEGNESGEQPEASRVPERAAPQTRLRILVIDDEPLICNWLANLLRDTCDVTVLMSSRTALQRIVAGDLFDVVLCDLMMPELTGMDLFDEVLARRSDMAERLVFMTGGAFTDQASAFLARMAAKTLRKPFRVHELFAVIEAQARRGRGAHLS